jgi:hypothetical protein
MGVSTRPSEGHRPVVDPAQGGSRVVAGGKYEAYSVASAGSAGYKRGSAPMKVGAIPRDGRWPQLQKDPAEDVNTQPLR